MALMGAYTVCYERKVKVGMVYMSAGVLEILGGLAYSYMISSFEKRNAVCCSDDLPPDLFQRCLNDGFSRCP